MSCTIIIFHFESLAYLRACIRRIRMYKRNDIRQKIIIADQSNDGSVIKTIINEFGNSDDVTFVHMAQYGSGYSVDYVIRNCIIDTDFMCTIDVDTIPIHKNWLYVPLMLVKEDGFSFVGVHAEIESAYSHMGNFYCMCQHFRVGRTSDYKQLSLNAGFIKNDSRKNISGLNQEWRGWSDDGVIAHWWEDKYTNHFKLTLAVTDYLGVAPLEGRYGRYTDDLVLHMGFSYNWKMVKDKKKSMGAEFIALMKKMDTEGLSDTLIDEIIKELIPLERQIARQGWDGMAKKTLIPTEKLNKRIEELKKV